MTKDTIEMENDLRTDEFLQLTDWDKVKEQSGQLEVEKHIYSIEKLIEQKSKN